MYDLSYVNVYWVYTFMYDILYKGKIYPNGYYNGKKRPFYTLYGTLIMKNMCIFVSLSCWIYSF